MGITGACVVSFERFFFLGLVWLFMALRGLIVDYGRGSLADGRLASEYSSCSTHFFLLWMDGTVDEWSGFDDFVISQGYCMRFTGYCVAIPPVLMDCKFAMVLFHYPIVGRATVSLPLFPF